MTLASCIQHLNLLLELQLLALIEKVAPSVAVFLEQGRNVFDCKVGNLHALLNLFPGKRHGDGSSPFRPRRENCCQTFAAGILHPINVNLFFFPPGDRSLNCGDLWRPLRHFARQQSRKLRHTFILICRLQRQIYMYPTCSTFSQGACFGSRSMAIQSGLSSFATVECQGCCSIVPRFTKWSREAVVE